MTESWHKAHLSRCKWFSARNCALQSPGREKGLSVPFWNSLNTRMLDQQPSHQFLRNPQFPPHPSSGSGEMSLVRGLTPNDRH